MAEVLKEFPVKASRYEQFQQFFDGQAWKIAPSEFDFDDGDTKGLRNRVTAASKKFGVNIRTCVTLDGHVVVQKSDVVDARTAAMRATAVKARAAKAAAKTHPVAAPGLAEVVR